MTIKHCWIISLIALSIGLLFFVTDCSGWWFDSAQEKARAAAHLDTVQTDNQIRKERARNDLVHERMAMLGPVGSTAAGASSTWMMIAIFLGGIFVVGFIAVAVVVLKVVLKAMMLQRDPIIQAFPPAQSHRRIYVDDRGHEYKVGMIQIEHRQTERRA